MYSKSYSFVLFLLILFFLTSNCSNSGDNQPLDPSSTIALGNDIFLIFEHSGLSEDQMEIIEDKITIGIASINTLMPIDNLEIRIVNNSTYLIPEIGIGGYNPGQNEVIIHIDINFHDIEGSLEEELIPMLAHEIHHAKRRRSVGYGNTLLQAVITEGLADHFSIEVTGINPPPWSVAITGTELQDLINTASNSWNSPSYNHSTWFFGSGQNIPRWAGYSIGYELVKNYLSENPDKLPSTLHNESADSFLP